MLRLVSVICCLLFLGACSTAPHLNVYDGLLPAGYQIKESPDPLSAEALKSKTVVLVTSTNFNTYTTRWQDYYENGADEQHKATMRGAAAVMALSKPLAGIGSGMSRGVDATDGGGNAVRQASDPRTMVVRVYSTLGPYFKSVSAAADFAEAQDLKADYIVLIDFYGTFNAMGDTFLTRGGVYMLDGSLRRVFQVEGKADVHHKGSDFLTVMSGPAAGIAATARTYEQGLDITTSQILAGVRTKLGPAPRQ